MKDATFSAARLLELYERISDAEDAILRLRRFVLDLAVRGKLVEQDASDEPAAELLKRIAQEKARLVKAKVIKKSDVESVTKDEEPYVLPIHWAWTRLGSIGDWGAGSTPSRGNSDLYGGSMTWLKSGELNDNTALAGSEETVTEIAVQKGSFRVNKPGDVLIAMYGATIGKLAILAETAVTNQAVCGCTPFDGVANRFLFLFLLAYRANFHAASEGGAQPNISKVKIVGTPFPLPPLAEQHRIVAKVDELMALCDRLEQARAGREAVRDRLTTASLARLTAPETDAQALPAEVGTGSASGNATNTSAFQSHARLALQSLPTLTTRPDQLKTLRQTILNLAVRGKLVAQDAADEPAAELLARIASERATKAKEAKVRTKRPIADADGDGSTDLPEGWALQALGNLVDPTATISYGVLVPGPDVEDGVPFVRAQDLSLSGHAPRPNKTIAPEIEAPYARTRLKGGEILLCVVGSIGKLGIAPASWAGANIARAVVRIAPVGSIASAYLLLTLQSDVIRTYFTEATRTVAQPTLNVGLLEVLPIALPPLAEQHRIVAKVDALMTLCDQLEASLTTTATTRSKLLNALLHEALEPSEKEMEMAE